MPFIVKEDFEQAIYEDILDALTKGDDNAITSNINSTIDEMASYLNGRYDTAVIFAKTGDARNKYLLRIGIDLCSYYLYKMHNPRKITALVAADYEKALEKLAGIQAGKINPVGLELPVADPPGSTNGNGDSVQWGSDAANENGY